MSQKDNNFNIGDGIILVALVSASVVAHSAIGAAGGAIKGGVMGLLTGGPAGVVPGAAVGSIIGAKKGAFTGLCGGVGNFMPDSLFT